MSDSASEEGYEAHSQNIERGENPYINPAIRWDNGWTKRETERKRHHLDKSKTPTFSNFVRTIFK